MQLTNYLEKHRREISMYLTKYFSELIESAPKEYKEMYRNLHDFSLRGKMVRGSFTLLSYEIFGGKKIEDALPVAASLEINHSALLIHDDIMDNDNLRRGESSMHAQYISMAEAKGIDKPKDFGQAMGIIIGDIGITLAYELLQHYKGRTQRKELLFQNYTSVLKSTCWGQAMDVVFASGTTEPSEKEILEMYRLKTARYSFVNPFTLGAIGAGLYEKLSRSEKEEFEMFFENMGIVYQMVDDEFGIFGVTQEIGKEIGSDVVENKKTLMRHYLLERISLEEREWVMSLSGSGAIGKKDLDRLKKLLVDSGTFDALKAKLSNMKQVLLADIDHLPVLPEYSPLIRELVEYNFTRSK